MTVIPQKRPDLIDVRELRAAPLWEIRAGSADTVVLEGYASTFEPYEMYGGPAAGGWIEQIGRNAFDKTLREKPDLHLLINHEGMPLARTKSGTLDLSVDDGGLKVRAELDRSDPDVQRLEAKMRRRDMDEMSFAFRVKSQSWAAAPGYDDPQGLRLITEVSLHRGDVSVVNFGANPTTTSDLLGRRRKGKGGVRKTLTAAEAAEIMRVDAKRSRGKPRMTYADARRQMAFDESVRAAQQAIGHSVVSRAAELLGIIDSSVPLSTSERAWQILREVPRPGDAWSYMEPPPGTPYNERRELRTLQAQYRVFQSECARVREDELISRLAAQRGTD